MLFTIKDFVVLDLYMLFYLFMHRGWDKVYYAKSCHALKNYKEVIDFFVLMMLNTVYHAKFVMH